jgi:hypothetical protein
MWRLVVVFLGLLILVHSTGYACDTAFVQEPGREPDRVEIDTWRGLVTAHYDLLDGRELVTIRIILTQTTEDSTLAELYPFLYIVHTAGMPDLTYRDIGGHGHCWEIDRYR